MLKTTFALCYTVKNDKDLLLSSCLYHLKKGCSKIYIFDDGSEDGTIDTVKNLPRVEIHKSIKPVIDDTSPQWLKNEIHLWDDWMDIRKNMNTYQAAKWAQKENIYWLGSIDSDEAISTKIIKGEDILETLEKVDNKYNQILLRNLEVLPQTENIKNPFLECSYFYKRFIITEQVHRFMRAIFYKITKNSEWQAWFDYFFYKLRFAGALHHLFIDPIDQSKIPSGYYLGYNNYKSLVKTSEVDDFDFKVHKWVKGKKKPRNYIIGHILHYDLYSPQSFINKFTQRPKNMLLKVFYLRYRLALLALNSTETEVISFFKQNLVVKNPSRSRIRDLIVEINDVKNTLEESKG